MSTEFKVVLIAGSIYLSLLFYSGVVEERVKAEHHKEQIAACMQAGHERLWCEGLLK